jgi:hypothetical protein
MRRAAKSEEQNAGTQNRHHLEAHGGSPDGEDPGRRSLPYDDKEDVCGDRDWHAGVHEEKES